MAAQGGRYFSAGLAGLVVNVKYAILLAISGIAGLAWLYYTWLYPVPDDNELFGFDFESYDYKLLFADECKRACAVVIVFCVLLAAIFGAAEW